MKTKAPIDATEDDLLHMDRDNLGIGDHSILTDSFNVSISTQKMGEPPSQHVTIPRKTFDKLIRWYIAPQTLKG